MRPAIEVRSITKRYRGGALANDDISLSVARGMMFGVLGPNGAGKTTLVRQITGELASTSGDIFVHDTNVAREPIAAKSLMGVVPQEASPYAHLTPVEHLTLFGRLHSLSASAARARTEALIDALGLRSTRVRPPPMIATWSQSASASSM